MFRSLRLTRVVRIVKAWSKLRNLVETVIRSFSAVGNLAMLTFIFVFIMALLMKSIFAHPAKGSTRYSFDSTGDSIVTVFIVLTGENWNEVMNQEIYNNDFVYPPCIFFIIILFFGNFMLLNLFLAILLRFITDNDPDAQND